MNRMEHMNHATPHRKSEIMFITIHDEFLMIRSGPESNIKV